MSWIIHCTAERDDASFHPDGTAGFSVLLAPRIEQQHPVIGSRGVFAELVRRIHEDLRIGLYTVVEDAKGDPSLGTRLDVASVLPGGAAQPDQYQQFVNWLAARQPTPSSDDFWAGGAAETVDSENMKASDAARAAHQWPGPLAHRHRMTNVVRVHAGVLTADIDHLVALPFFRDPPDDVSDLGAPQRDGDEIVLSYDADDEGRVVTCRTNAVGLKPEPPSLVDTDTGFLDSSAFTQDVAALLDRLEERASSAFWLLPVLMEPGVHAINDAPIAEQLADGTLTQGQAAAARAPWLAAKARISALTALDPLFVALRLPGLPSDAAGPVIGPLVDAIVAEFDLDEDGVASAVRGAIDAHFLFQNPIAFAELARLFELSAEPDEGEPAYPLLLAALRGEALPDGADQAQLDRELGELLVRMTQEAGVEQMLLRLLAWEPDEDEDEDDPSMIVRELTTNLESSLPGLDEEARRQRLRRAFGAYRAFLLGPFDGAGAVRQANGMVFEAAATAERLPNTSTAEVLRAEIVSMNFAHKRFGDTDLDDDRFEPIATALPSLAEAVLDADMSKAIRSAVAEAHGDRLAETFPEANTRRFEPDPRPRDLPVPLAGRSGTDEIEAFNERYNGVGVLIRAQARQEDDDWTNWACANLAEATRIERDENGGENGREPLPLPVVQPLVPTLSDGRSRVFAAYRGEPFSADVAGSVHAEIYEGSGEARRYDIDVFDGVSHPKPPPLAYGTLYETAAFAISIGGALPDDVRSGNDEPWRIKEEIGEPKKTTVHEHSRRTAIGRVGIEEHVSAARPPRIGQSIGGVQPLVQDYPRHALTAAAPLDLLRQPNGRGAISFDPLVKSDGAYVSQTRTVDLPDIDAAVPSTIVLEIHADANVEPGGAPLASCEVEISANSAPLPTAAATVEFRREKSSDVNEDAQLTIMVEGTNVTVSLAVLIQEMRTQNETYWLRLRLVEGAAISLARPQAGFTPEPTQHDVDRPPLLLLAPPDGPFEERHSEPVGGSIITPRTGFDDFMRWMQNPVLRAEHIGSEGEAHLDAILTALEEANALRPYDESRENDTIGDLLDRLPDPAVRHLHMELAPLDRLGVAMPEPQTAIVSLNAVGDAVDEDAVDKIKDHGRSDGKTVEKMLAGYRSFLKALLAPYRLDFTANGKGRNLELTPNESPVSIAVPAGTVAQLRVRPMVEERRFDVILGGTAAPALHRGLRQLAYADMNDGEKSFVLFDAERLTVETMTAEMGGSDWPVLIREAVTVAPAARARSYDLLAGTRGNVQRLKVDEEADWRRVHWLDVHSQRFSFTGRPIYTWYEPEPPDGAETPAVEISDAAEPGTALRRFETEIFFDRSDDNEIVRTVRLDPLPGTTRLETVPWEQPSATWFRHRFVARSRYEGAVKPGQRAVVQARSWPEDARDAADRDADVWAKRVAMLADHDRQTLTRPQLRAWLPLTEAPDAAEAPGLLAFLQEEPLAGGGLADRLSSEIESAFEYGFEVEDEQSVLKLMSARREVGPDPRFAYAPLPDGTGGPDGEPDGAPNLAQSVTMAGEGPIGLTFDRDAAIGAAFANSQWMFSPLPLTDGADAYDFSEHFIRQRLHRHLSPRWLFDPEGAQAGSVENSFALSDTLWFEVEDEAEGGEVEASLDLRVRVHDAPSDPVLSDTDRRSLVHITRKQEDGSEGGVWTVTADNVFRDPTAFPDTGADVRHKPQFVLAVADASRVSSIAILLQPLSEIDGFVHVYARRRASADALASDVEAGLTDAPLLLASYRWAAAAPGKMKIAVARFVEPNGMKAPRRTKAAEPTFSTWTRTGKNAARVFDAVSGQELPTSRVRATLNETDGNETDGRKILHFENAETGEPLWLRSREQHAMPATHTHRQLAAIVTRPSDELGRKVQRYVAALRAGGRVITLPDELCATPDQLDQLAEARVHVVEYEMPARPLAGGLTGDLTTHFGAVDLDMRAVVGARPDGVLVSFRFLPGFREVRRLRLSLTALDAEGAAVNAEQTIEIGLGLDSDDEPVAMELVLDNGCQVPTAAGTITLDDGSIAEVGNVSVTSGESAVPFDAGTFAMLKIVRAADAQEDALSPFWCDVSWSTLYRRRRDEELDTAHFPFEWLFSDTPHNAPPVDPGSPADLSRLTEVQARILTVSPPIPIKRS